MKLYTFYKDDFTKEMFNKWYSLISDEKKKRIDKIKNESNKASSLIGEMLTKQGISETLNIPVEKIEIATTPKGKPYAKNLPIHFNISHSHDLVICGISESKIGVDVEKIRNISLKIAKKICLPNELEYIFQCKEKEIDFTFANNDIFKRFFEIWTGKEAIFKYNGTGLADFKAVDTLNNSLLHSPIFMDDYIIRIACQDKL